MSRNVRPGRAEPLVIPRVDESEDDEEDEEESNGVVPPFVAAPHPMPIPELPIVTDEPPAPAAKKPRRSAPGKKGIRSRTASKTPPTEEEEQAMEIARLMEETEKEVGDTDEEDEPPVKKSSKGKKRVLEDGDSPPKTKKPRAKAGPAKEKRKRSDPAVPNFTTTIDPQNFKHLAQSYPVRMLAGETPVVAGERIAAELEFAMFGGSIQPRLFAHEKWPEYVHAVRLEERMILLAEMAKGCTAKADNLVLPGMIDGLFKQAMKRLAPVCLDFTEMDYDSIIAMSANMSFTEGAASLLSSWLSSEVLESCTAAVKTPASMSGTVATETISARDLHSTFFQQLAVKEAKTLRQSSDDSFAVYLYKLLCKKPFLPNTTGGGALLPEWLAIQLEGYQQLQLQKSIFRWWIAQQFGVAADALDFNCAEVDVRALAAKTPADRHRSYHLAHMLAVSLAPFERANEHTEIHCVRQIIDAYFRDGQFVFDPPKKSSANTPKPSCGYTRDKFERHFKDVLFGEVVRALDIDAFLDTFPEGPLPARAPKVPKLNKHKKQVVDKETGEGVMVDVPDVRRDLFKKGLAKKFGLSSKAVTTLSHWAVHLRTCYEDLDTGIFDPEEIRVGLIDSMKRHDAAALARKCAKAALLFDGLDKVHCEGARSALAMYILSLMPVTLLEDKQPKKLDIGVNKDPISIPTRILNGEIVPIIQ